eukprot:TRINITY_DN17286_c0_g1_i1.p1 TRINITY_DN17286_c0_g1~~TRINITY_DN17286_c0_g1_i1.p1  ORF type:complete len:228 (-),score=52.48 TRINITY_DN17286_c0_g1_i1:177-824(-)
MQQHDRSGDRYKVIIIGDSTVGKTSILRCMVYGKFDANASMTVGVDFFEIKVFVPSLGDEVKVSVWDTGGQERFRSITSAYMNGVSGCLLVYDVTSDSSFRSLPSWLGELRSNAGEGVKVMLCGNKSDKEAERQIKTGQGREFADENELDFIETSALRFKNIREAFTRLVEKMACNADSQQPPPSTLKDPTEPILQPSATVKVVGQSPQQPACCL